MFLFRLTNCFLKKLAQFQNFSFFGKFHQFLTILHDFPLEIQDMAGNRQIPSKKVLDNISILMISKIIFFSKKVDQFQKILNFYFFP